MFQSAESRYNQWMRDHYRFLLRSAWAMTGSRAVAEDVVQDCFASAWQHRGQLRQPELARPWLFQIMRRNALRHMVPGPLSLDDSEEAANRPAPASGIEDRLDVVGLQQQQSLPGSPQLLRPCDIEGHLVYHLTTLFEKGGMVTAFAFDQPVVLKDGSGWWGDVHWQVMRSGNGNPLVLVAQKKKALAVAQASFAAAGR